MRIRSFIIAYALVLAILLFADRRPKAGGQDHYSHVVDLTTTSDSAHAKESTTRIISPAAVIPGTWAAGQIPAERLIAPLVVLDLGTSSANSSVISLNDIAVWEERHGMIPQGAVVAIRNTRIGRHSDHSAAVPPVGPLPIEREAARFLTDARYAIGFAVETPVNLTSDRTMARQLALRGSYVLEGTASFTALPATGSLIIVAPAKNKKPGEAPVRVLAMVR